MQHELTDEVRSLDRSSLLMYLTKLDPFVRMSPELVKYIERRTTKVQVVDLGEYEDALM